MSFIAKLDIFTLVFVFFVFPILYYVLQQLARLFIKIIKLKLDGWIYKIIRKVGLSAAASFSIRRYCKLQLNGRSKNLIVPARVPIPLNTDDVFVPISFERFADERTSCTHDQFTTLEKQVLIIGDPGSGKTSLMKKLFRDSCRKSLKNAKKSKLPIFFELKNVKVPENPQQKNNWLFEQLIFDLKGMSVYKIDECIENYIQETGVIFFLDGLDEISTHHYPEVKKGIASLSEHLQKKGYNNQIILTMRTQFYYQIKNEIVDDFNVTLSIKNFSPGDIYEFLTRWPFKNEKENNILRIYNDLTEKPNLREMCGNPLILSMYVAEDFYRAEFASPESRTEFYSNVTDELIIRRRLQQKGPIAGRLTIKDDRETILGALALNHLLDFGETLNTLSFQSAIKLISNYYRCTEGDAENVFRELSKETGLITEEKIGETYRFIHLTFCEFLAAKHAINGKHEGWSELIRAHKKSIESSDSFLKSRLIEVIPFACGLTRKIDRNKVMDDVSDLNDIQLTVRCFLETKLYSHSYWPILLESEFEYLTNLPSSKWDEAWCKRLFLFNVCVKDFDKNTSSRFSQGIMHNNNSEVIESLFRKLAADNPDNISRIFFLYANQDAIAANRLANFCGIDLLKEFPEIIISTADQRPLFSSIVQRMKNARGDDRIKLLILLAETSLRFQIVANWMYKWDPLEELYDLELTLDRKRVEGKVKGIKASFLKQTMGIALSDLSKQFLSDKYPLLKNLSLSFPLPRVNYLKQFVYILIFSLMYFTSAFLFIVSQDEGFWRSTLRLFWILLTFIFYILFLRLDSRNRTILRLHKQLFLQKSFNFYFPKRSLIREFIFNYTFRRDMSRWLSDFEELRQTTQK